MWYFAYGSNLCTTQMAARTGVSRAGADRSRRAQLPGYRLAFNMGDGSGWTYANIVHPGDGVLGVLYRCSRQDLEALDGFEEGYERTRVDVLDETGAKVDAVVYIARPEQITAGQRPRAEYLQRVIRGAREHGLPEQYIHSIEAAAGV
ncbi:MAG: hypothetical protein JWO38_7626 [Gemmataceae bacterium]|nr:hypothetical protein [Gemmataceae bacterium]